MNSIDQASIDFIFRHHSSHLSKSFCFHRQSISILVLGIWEINLNLALAQPHNEQWHFHFTIVNISRHSVGHMQNQHTYFDTEKWWVQNINFLPFFIHIYVNFDIHFVERTHTFMNRSYSVWQLKCILQITKTAHKLPIYPSDGLHHCVDYFRVAIHLRQFSNPMQ